MTWNKTTLENAKLPFTKYDAQAQKHDDGSEFPEGTQLIFKRGKHFTTLLFDNKNILKSIGITTVLVDPVAN
uniref:Uncharacterized protein n=1 Tax=Staphylococcus aureus TaxID=1280 RepID=A0AAE6F2P4_STAAU